MALYGVSKFCLDAWDQSIFSWKSSSPFSSPILLFGENRTRREDPRDGGLAEGIESSSKM